MKKEFVESISKKYKVIFEDDPSEKTTYETSGSGGKTVHEKNKYEIKILYNIIK